MKKEITMVRIIGGIFTIWGIIFLIRGDFINGFLAIIVGELVDLPYRFNRINKYKE